jgi:medium-chain acyl-[acyl-carrier-protein] hydrolase
MRGNILTEQNLVHLTEPSAPVARLVCFPHAGAGAYAFGTWMEQVHEDIELIAVRLPGRETLFEQVPLRSMSLIGSSVGDILLNVAQPGPIGLFGYCAGAFAAFEAARRMTERQESPSLLAVCSQVAPHANVNDTVVHNLPAGQLKEVLRALGGTQPIVLEREEFWELAEPALRADYEAAETYSASPEPKLSCDIIAFCGSHDDDVPPQEIGAWAEVTTGTCATHLLDGGHFLLQSRAADVLAEVEHHLLGARPGE